MPAPAPVAAMNPLPLRTIQPDRDRAMRDGATAAEVDPAAPFWRDAQAVLGQRCSGSATAARSVES